MIDSKKATITVSAPQGGGKSTVLNLLLELLYSHSFGTNPVDSVDDANHTIVVNVAAAQEMHRILTWR